MTAEEQQDGDQQQAAPQQQADQQQQQRPTGVKLPAGPICDIQQATQQQRLQPQLLLPPDVEISGSAARLAARLTWSQRQLAPFLAALPDEEGETLLRTLHDPRSRVDDLR